ncbi:hypothetical protein SNEBB_006893 [Seison nebaliae]|nr:hypothetical protein SNEBB_006893 [Seison nebaliae]
MSTINICLFILQSLLLLTNLSNSLPVQDERDMLSKFMEETLPYKNDNFIPNETQNVYEELINALNRYLAMQPMKKRLTLPVGQKHPRTFVPRMGRAFIPRMGRSFVMRMG